VTRPPMGRDCLANRASGGFHQSVSAVGQRSAKVIANALSACLHRMVHRALPRPVGSRDLVNRDRHSGRPARSGSGPLAPTVRR
jgi:hypothetical protein